MIAEAEPQERLFSLRERVAARIEELHAFAFTSTGPGSHIDRVVNACPQPHATFGNAERHGATEVTGKRCRQRIASRGVDAPHPAHVAQQFAVLEKFGDGAFHGSIATRIACCAQCCQLFEHC